MCGFACIERQTKLNCEIGIIIYRCEYIVCKMKSLKQFQIILRKRGILSFFVVLVVYSCYQCC